MVQLVKNPPAMQETWVWSLGWKDALEKAKATNSSILAWRIPWTVAHQAPLSFIISQSLLRFMPTELVILTISSSATPLSFCLQSFSASESFPMSRLFSSGSQSIGASASPSVLPMNIQGWFPLGLTSWISLQTQESSPTQFKSINSLVLSFLYSPTLTSIHDYWKNHTFD